MKVRRVVTGHNAAGKAVFASDALVDSIDIETLASAPYHRLWGADGVRRFPDDGTQPAMPQYFPSVGGFRFGMFSVPPDREVVAHLTKLGDRGTAANIIAELDAKLPGLSETLELDHPGMHTTDTIDFEYVISGRCVLELDDGAEVELGPGDTVVQNGTRHHWRNPFTEPCRMVVVLIGAERAGAKSPERA
jgi:mannose-6-phosphate isomerase-like protein (cupin superfamily)